MRLSISNIAWDKTNDDAVYSLMKEYSFCGLEIAPTRIVPNNPYDHINEIIDWKREINLDISSMQSILFGIDWNFNRSKKEYDLLMSYLKKSIFFASAINCNNLVFGCPKNRSYSISENAYKNAKDFFKELGDYAFINGTCIGLEPNPLIYNTNFINYTYEAIDFIKNISSDGLKLNLDIGTMIANNEDIAVLKSNVHLINHVHISEPYLESIKHRNIHYEIKKILTEEGYDKYVSVEMKNGNSIDVIEDTMRYIKNVFD